MDYNSYEAIEGQGCIFTGQAGSRKTTLLCDVVMKTDKSLVLAFTNKAIVNVKERLEREEANDMLHTFDSYFSEWANYENRLANKTFFIEEFSMVPNKWMTKIYETSKTHNNQYSLHVWRPKSM